MLIFGPNRDKPFSEVGKDFHSNEFQFELKLSALALFKTIEDFKHFISPHTDNIPLNHIKAVLLPAC